MTPSGCARCTSAPAASSASTAQYQPYVASSTTSGASPARAITTASESSTGKREDDTHDRVRRDKVDKVGKITLRHGGTLYSIGIGRTHAGTRVIVLAHNLDIRIIDAATGELLRELILDTTKRYQGTGRPPGRPRH